ncbi:hypothetical protein QBC36DRAFT_181599 [Triangularia setosa]|uniref:Uncharacterized protein n=1 Tax=Triangularia setosa TaxID=2587417 RepID=A0AAN6WBK3_9PEZI|nr:hypothetical protein QBC36DRAFT_181599 [Podospora setosa]
MAVTIQHLNSDATFLFTFEPRSYRHVQPGPSRSPKLFRILLDPWITGPAKFIHPKIAKATHRQPPCILSLLELPEPDLVIISHNSSKHCNEATLRQLPAIGTKTIILSTPASDSKIKSWKNFEKGKVKILPRWEPSKPGDPKGPNILRYTVPSIPPGEPGEVTVAFIPQKHDLSGLHYAIAITYRPPSPPLYHLPLPQRLRIKSQTSLISPVTTTSSQHQQHPIPQADDRPISILYVPHGISYSTIHSYATNHLISEAALPLTVLLHPFNVHHQAPFWHKTRDIVPSGIEIAIKLAAKTWIGAHDGDLVHRGLIKKPFTRKRQQAKSCYTEDDVTQLLSDTANGSNTTTTTVLVLESGEKTTLHSSTTTVGKAGTTTIAENNRAIHDEQEQQQQIENQNNTADGESEGQNQKGTSKEEEGQQTKDVSLTKPGSPDSGKGQGQATAQADMLMGSSLEKCNWRSNLELFLEKGGD